MFGRAKKEDPPRERDPEMVKWAQDIHARRAAADDWLAQFTATERVILDAYFELSDHVHLQEQALEHQQSGKLWEHLRDTPSQAIKRATELFVSRKRLAYADEALREMLTAKGMLP